MKMPGVGVSEHPLPDGRTVVVAVNYEPENAVCPIKTSKPVEKCLRGSLENGTLTVLANDAAVEIAEKMKAPNVHVGGGTL